MVTKTSQGLRVEEGRTRLITLHNGEDLIFLHPSYGPDNYANVEEQIEKNGLVAPTMSQTASLIHAAYNSNDKYSGEIKGLMKNKGLCAFTGTLYTPNKVAYIQDKPEIKNGMPFMNESELVKKLENKDPSVRFVPLGFNIGEMSALELSKNPYLLALAGEEGAEKLAEVADKHKNKPYLRSFESVDQPLTRVSALYSVWGPVGRWLYVDGGCHGGRVGCAFGVEKTGKASRAEK